MTRTRINCAIAAILLNGHIASLQAQTSNDNSNHAQATQIAKQQQEIQQLKQELAQLRALLERHAATLERVESTQTAIVNTQPVPVKNPDDSPRIINDAAASEANIEVATLNTSESSETPEASTSVESNSPIQSIQVGGAVRFQYAYKEYDRDDKDRGGDFDFDVFRINFDGSFDDILFSAEYRWYQYMDTIHHAYLGYQFDEHWQGQIGIMQVPFGNLKWNSNSFFFNTGFYVGLEDDYDTGLKFLGRYDKHDIQLAFYKTDELGGIDGFVGDKTFRYSYDIVGTRKAGEGIYDAPSSPLAEDSTFNARYSYHFDHAEVGMSLMHGNIEGAEGDAGDRHAYAFHVKSQFDDLGVTFQYTDYEFDLNDGAELITVGAYSFYDTIPTSADIYNLNLTYSMDVEFGPVSNLKFYNDFNVMTNKSGGLEEDTILNVLGVQVTSGNLYTLIDLAMAKNQPFVGGSLAGDSNETNTRLNINFGVYF